MTNILSFILIVLLPLSITMSDEPEPGQLIINDHVIYENREETAHQRSIGHELVPNLFLSDMTERELSRRTLQETELAEAQALLFIYPQSEDIFSTEKVQAILFTDQPLESVRVMSDSMSNTTVTALPSWIVGMLVGAMLATLGYVGVIIGRRLAKRRRQT